MMLKDLSSTFEMSECLYTFALYDNPMNVTSRWDMKFTDIYLFAADIQWRLDTHWGLWISNVVSQTKSIFMYSSPFVIGPVKYRSSSTMPMP